MGFDMSREVRFDVKLHVSPETFDAINRMASERNLPRNGLVLQALGVLQAAHEAAREGYYHGLTKDRANLDIVLISPL